MDSLAAAVAAARKGDAASAFALLLAPIKSSGAGKGGGMCGAVKGFDRLASDWKIDSATIEIARDKSGANVVLGSGAASIVYRGYSTVCRTSPSNCSPSRLPRSWQTRRTTAVLTAGRRV